MTFPAQAELAPGWKTPIIAAELARSAADLSFMAGPENESVRLAMDAGHRFDNLFPFAYGSLLFGSAWTARGQKVAYVAMLGALLAIGFDLRENAVLMEITQVMRDGGGPEPLLDALFMATWTKWCAIATALACIGVAEWTESRARAGALLLAAISVPLALVTASPACGELMGLGTVAGFVVLVVRAWQQRRPPAT